MTRILPKTASVAIPMSDDKLHAPSATRNIAPIIEAATPFLPQKGTALEIASGTGEHILHHAAAFSGITWQPTDIAPERVKSIAAWVAESKLTNILEPELLDATQSGWATQFAPKNVVILSNLLHLISATEVQTIISEVSKLLAPDGVFVIYGPFLRGSEFASPSDVAFDQSLRESDAEIGYKSFQSIQKMQEMAGLTCYTPIEMPANNLLLVAKNTIGAAT